MLWYYLFSWSQTVTYQHTLGEFAAYVSVSHKSSLVVPAKSQSWMRQADISSAGHRAHIREHQRCMYKTLWGCAWGVSLDWKRGHKDIGWRWRENSWRGMQGCSWGEYPRVWWKPGGASLVVLLSEGIGQTTETLAALLWMVWKPAVGVF